MSLFESVETPEKARIAGGTGATTKTLEAGSAGETHANVADGLFGWQRALDTAHAVCA